MSQKRDKVEITRETVLKAIIRILGFSKSILEKIVRGDKI